MFHQVLDPSQYDGKIKHIIEAVNAGIKITPDDWALIQETLPAEDPAFKYFRAHRKEISRQLVRHDKSHLAAPILHFTHNNESYVLLMQNIGLVYATTPEPLQWTAHSTRVDAEEQRLLNNDKTWQLLEEISQGDASMTYFLAAIVRRVRELGIKFETEDIRNIQPIDREGAGLPELDKNYNTKFFYVNLGERDPQEIARACQQSESRFAKWTHCFKLSELQHVRRNEKFTAVVKFNQDMLFEYEGKDYPLRYTTWTFIKALQLLNRYKLNKESVEKNPWEMGDVSPEGAISWVQNRLDAEVQITLFHEKNSRLTSPVIHAYAAKTGMDPEDIAFYAMRPERLILQAVIANLLVSTVVIDSKDFDSRVWELFHRYFNTHPDSKDKWEKRYAELSLDTPEDKEKVLALIEKINLIADKYIETGLYHINETSEEIALLLVKQEKFHRIIQAEIKEQVEKMVRAYVADEKLERMPCYELIDRQCFGVTGPVASGKSTSENRARALLAGRPAIFISSDEWYELLTANQNLEGFTMHRGKIALAEAWRVKELTWELIRIMENQGRAPNWIQEAVNPASIAAPPKAHTTIFVNTSNPYQAVKRVKMRGEKSGRYVAGSATVTSYRFPWIHFVGAIKRNVNDPLVTIHVIDTDLLFVAGKSETAIATFKEGVLEINNLHRFFSFIERFYRIHAKPTSDDEVLSNKQPNLPKQLIKELSKLFESGFDIKIVYKGKIIPREELEKMAVQRYKVAGFLKKHLVDKHDQPSSDSDSDDNKLSKKSQ